MWLRKGEFTKVLNSNIGKQMFTSIPLLLSQLSLVLLFQFLILLWKGDEHPSLFPSFFSISLSVLILLLFFYVKIKSIKTFHNFFIFMVLLIFFIGESLLLFLYNVHSLWFFILLLQIVGAYYLLNKIFFYSLTGLIFSVSLIYFFKDIFIGKDIEPLAFTFFILLLSLIIHWDRRKSFLKLGRIYYEQQAVNKRFEQLEENISQIFILCSADFTEINYISSGFERMFALDHNLLLKKPHRWMSFIHMGDKERIKLEFAAAKTEKIYREFDFRVTYKENSEWLNFQLFPIESKTKNQKDAYAIIIDNVSENKMSELKLAEAKSLEAEYAARIQKNLLFSDSDLKIKHLDVAAESIPSMSVGGDFFDFYRFSEHIVDIIIADVMGKGMIASMLGAASKSAFMKSRLDLTVLENQIPQIEQIMTLCNETLTPELMEMGKFITMQYARLNMEKSIFTFIDSGHTSLFYYNAAYKTWWSLKGWNMPIGFNSSEDLVSSIIPFEKDDIFFLYSDGITEAENEEGVQFGQKRLNYLLNNSAHLTSNQIINKVRNIVFHYSSSSGFADDVTCITMKIGEIKTLYNKESFVFHGLRDSLDPIRSFIATFLRKNFKAINDEDIHSIVLAVNEASANIIEHNYEKDEELEGREILIEAGENQSICYINLYCDGNDFEWANVEVPEVHEMKSGGYGLFIMKEIMDSISYSSNIDGVQCLSLVKKMQSNPSLLIRQKDN